MKDLPKNLRDTAEFFDSFPTGVHPQRTLWIRQAADEIERLHKALDTCADTYAKLLDQLGAGADM